MHVYSYPAGPIDTHRYPQPGGICPQAIPRVLPLAPHRVVQEEWQRHEQ
ncbi:MAG: hypothetical protein ACI9ME_001344 [Ilumatobacter sp.]